MMGQRAKINRNINDPKSTRYQRSEINNDIKNTKSIEITMILYQWEYQRS